VRAFRGQGHCICANSDERTRDNGASAAFDDRRKRVAKFIFARTFHDNELPAELTGSRN